MANIHDVDANELIEKAAVELGKDENIKAPEWAAFVKTGMSRERVPARADWWNIRAASILRAVYNLGPIGVSKLRTKYGGIKNRGNAPGKFYRGSGNIIRKALQQLEKAGLIKKDDKSKHKGRIVTSRGKSFLDKIATGIYKAKPKVEPKPEPKVEAKAPVKEVKKEAPKVEVPKPEVKK